MCLIHEAKLAISSELVLFHLTQQVLNVIILIIICTIHKLPSSKHAQNDTRSLIHSTLNQAWKHIIAARNNSYVLPSIFPLG